jgi:hypothetical protein
MCKYLFMVFVYVYPCEVFKDIFVLAGDYSGFFSPSKSREV